MGEYELVHVNIYNPRNSIFKSSRNDKAECFKYYCKAKEECELYANNKCINVGRAFGPSCVYGRREKETGFTTRARKFSEWISDKEKKYSDYKGNLQSSEQVISVIGEYFYLPYPHMALNNSIPFKEHSSLFNSGKPFIKKELFTDDVIITLINYRPQAIMGGEIRSYQKEVIPKFIKDLQCRYKDRFNSIIAIQPSINDYIKEYSYIGRKAILSTVKAGAEFKITKGLNQGLYIWDGERLICDNIDISFPITKGKSFRLTITPDDDSVIEITDNAQVTDNTEFTD